MLLFYPMGGGAMSRPPAAEGPPAALRASSMAPPEVLAYS